MQRLRLWGYLFTAPVAMFLVTAVGCGGGDSGSKPSGKPSTEQTKPGETPKASGEKTAIESTGWGTLKGTVKYDGDPPALTDYSADVDKHKDKDRCVMGDISNQSWKVNKDSKGVANVVVWVRPTEGKVFKEHPADKKTWKDLVTIDQPFCAFEPHVSVVFPSFDSKGKKPTGQKFKVLNSSTIAHNTKYAGNSLINPGDNITLPPKGEKEIALKPDGKQAINVNCDFHKWMTGYVWSFDHPYAAVTDKDGNFEIKDVPAGAELQVVAWQETKPSFSVDGKSVDDKGAGAPVKKVTLKDGDATSLDIKVKAK